MEIGNVETIKERTIIHDPVLSSLLLEHVLPFIKERCTGFEFATIDYVTTALCGTNRYVVTANINGRKNVRLIIGADGSIRNGLAYFELDRPEV